MDGTNNFIACSLWTDLSMALKDLNCCSGEFGRKTEPQYKRLQYSKKHNFVVFEIERTQFPGLAEGYFESKEAQNVFKEYLNCQKMDFMDLGPLLYFYFWLDTFQDENESPEFESVVRV